VIGQEHRGYGKQNKYLGAKQRRQGLERVAEPAPAGLGQCSPGWPF
jgi:hypothetical protein